MAIHIKTKPLQHTSSQILIRKKSYTMYVHVDQSYACMQLPCIAYLHTGLYLYT